MRSRAHLCALYVFSLTLFRYGDDEQTKSTSNDTQPPKPTPSTADERLVSLAPPQATQEPSSQKAVDPRHAHSPAGEHESEQMTGAPNSSAQAQPISAQNPTEDAAYNQNKGQEYSWNASGGGHGGHEQQGSDGAYGDHSTGSPAIKEDGCVYALVFCVWLVIFGFSSSSGAMSRERGIQLPCR